MSDRITLTSGWAVPETLRASALQLPDSTVNPAKWMHERLVKSIIEFEEALDETQEIGARLVNFGEREPIHINDVGYWGPDLVIFYGTNADKRPVELLQHVTQVSVLLVAMPKEHEQARRIGFELQKKLEPETTDDNA
jgi:Family of unknown function (DUF6173)